MAQHVLPISIIGGGHRVAGTACTCYPLPIITTATFAGSRPMHKLHQHTEHVMFPSALEQIRDSNTSSRQATSPCSLILNSVSAAYFVQAGLLGLAVRCS